MRLHSAIWLFAVICCSTTSAQWRVGNIGDPDTWEIHGATTFAPHKIREALRFDFETLVAAHPRASLSELPEVVAARVAKGLRHVGFPDPQVQASYNRTTRRLETFIDEGVRCRSDKVVVKGVSSDIAQAIAKRLTEKHQDLNDAIPEFNQHGQALNWTGPDGEEVKSEDPLWKKGDPAPFNQEMLKTFRARISKTFEAAGYYATEFTCKVVARGSVANLEIDVVDLGVPAIIHEIDVVGNEINTDAEIIRQANVKPGNVFSTTLRERILRDLWTSGRFIEQRVSHTPGERGVDLKITVVEAPKAPRVSEPLSREALTLLKCRQWLIAGSGKERDLVFAGIHEGTHVQLVVSRSGMLMTLDRQPKQDAPPEYVLSMATDGVGFYETRQRRKLQIEQPTLVLTLTTKLAINAENPEKPFNFGFGMGVRTPRSEEARATALATPLEFNLSAAPAFFVASASLSTEAEWDGSILTIGKDNGVMRIDERTGELLSYRISGEDGNDVMSMETAVGRYAKLREQLRAETANHQNQYDPQAPVSSTASFMVSSSFLGALADAFGNDQEEIDATIKQISALRSLIDAGLLRPIDHFVLQDTDDDNDKFKIPGPEGPENMFAAIARYAIGGADHLFARSSWPWTVTREVGFAVSGHRKHTDRALEELMASDDFGPLGHLALAELFAYINNDSLAAAIAGRGTTKLSTDQFRGDSEAILGKLQQHLLPVARWLGRLKEDQRAQLARSFSADPQIVEQIVAAIRDASDEEASLAILNAIDQLWDTSCLDIVKERLATIAKERGAAALEARKQASGDQ